MLIDKVKGTRQYIGPTIYMKWHIFAEWNLEILHLLSSIKTDEGKLLLPRSRNTRYQQTIEEQSLTSIREKIAGKKYLFSMKQWVLLRSKAKPKETGFAIGSPGAPHLICASDQIRASWVKADITIIGSGAAKSSV